jgi:acyl dehydratase
MLMIGSQRWSTMPPSSTRTRVAGSALSRLASAELASGWRAGLLWVEGARMTDRYLEDFAVGQTYGSSEQERIMAFAAEFDPQPFHLDEEAARNSIFGGLAASGWYTAAATMRMLVEGDLRPAGGILGLGFEELRWPRPVRPGDELHIESEVVEVRPSQSRPDRGLVKVRTTTLNQHGEAVQIIVGSLLVPRRSTS